MSFPCIRLISGDALHCEPTGLLKQYGWLPGTWVKYVKATRTFTKGAVASCERCGNLDYGAAFLSVGSSILKNGFDDSFPNDNEYNGVWTADGTGGYVSNRNINVDIGFDNNKQLDRLGSGIISPVITNTGVYKFYVYEKYDLAYRTTAGNSGGVLDWEATIGKFNVIYVSSRGLLTCEKENVNSYPIPYIIADVNNDEQGCYLLLVSD